MDKLSYCTIAVSELTEKDITAMYQLASTFYENIAPTEFLRCLADKDYCIVIRNEAKRVVGYQTQKLLHIPNGTSEIHGFYSEDFITELDEWDERVVVSEVISFYLQYIRKYGEFLWYLVCKDYHTYQMITKQFVEYYPNYHKQNQLPLKRAVNCFGKYLFNNEYDEKHGVIKYKYFRRKPNITKQQRKILKQSEPEAAFFMYMNPNFYRGNDLICVVRLTEEYAIISKENNCSKVK